MRSCFVLVFFVIVFQFEWQAQAETTTPKSGQVLQPSDQDPDSSRTNFNIYIENDTKNLGGSGDDRAYTSGVRLSFLYADNKLPNWTEPFPWLREIFDDRPFNFGLGIGQQISTPEDLQRSDPIGNDRPYAAWLYLSPTLTVSRGDRVTTFELDVGVIGPAALGREAQNGIHRSIRSPLANGWDNQLSNEPGVVLWIENKLSLAHFQTQQERWRYSDLIPYYGGGLGNVFTGGHAGIIGRLGYNLPQDFGPSRPSSSDGDAFIDSSGVSQTAIQRHWSAYLFAGAKGDVSLHNVFLDGSTFRDSIRVSRVPLVGEYEAGFFVQYKKLSLTWREVTRTPEFYERYLSHTFASLGLTYGQRF